MATEDHANTLRKMRICRFCLNDEGPLTNIHERDAKQTVPLPLQIMACVSIEVFKNDGMPQLICNRCRNITLQAYNFKTTCKKSDEALKLFLIDGDLKELRQVSQIVYKELNLQVPKQIKRLQETPPETPQSSQEKKIKIEDANQQVIGREEILIPDERTDVDESSQSMPDEDDVPDTVEMEEQVIESAQSIEVEINVNPVEKVPLVQTDVFPCNLCERSFPLKQLLDLHMKNHVREREHKCNICDKKFFSKYDLQKHQSTHSTERPYQCPFCDKAFSRETLLHRHEKTHIDVPQYLCVYCDRTFLSKNDLDQHSEKHKKARPFVCRICNKAFVFKQGLERHEASHTEERPHKCNYCEASFTSPIKLKRHITSHAGLRPYPCKLCKRTFLMSHHLTRHMRSHYASFNHEMQPVGQHKCDQCSMSFRRKDSLINHSTIHSMVNLKCVICNTVFENAKQVMNHITTHLSGLPYPCDKCDYSFETQDQLEEHEIKHAEMEYEEQIEEEVSREEAIRMVIDANAEADDGDGFEEGCVEFTITNEEEPEVVRRPKRQTKTKNYAEFLMEELGSDVENELIQEEQDDSQESSETYKVEEDSAKEEIKPIVRSEGTKVYTRKSVGDKSKVKQELGDTSQLQSASADEINDRSSILNLGLSQQDLNALPNKQYVDLKVGDKMLRVQKLMMTKAEIEQMAKKGKIEIKGDTILLRKSAPASSSSKPFRHTMENIIQSIKPNNPTRQVVKKTYLKKTKQDSSALNVSDEANNSGLEETHLFRDAI